MVSRSLMSSAVAVPPPQGHSPKGGSELTPPTPHPKGTAWATVRLDVVQPLR